MIRRKHKARNIAIFCSEKFGVSTNTRKIQHQVKQEHLILKKMEIVEEIQRII